VPDYTFETAPPPKVVVIPAQDSSEGMLRWIRKASAGGGLTMSVCVGAVMLAKTGLLNREICGELDRGPRCPALIQKRSQSQFQRVAEFARDSKRYTI
jgi:putative intracellular protease/amidase